MANSMKQRFLITNIGLLGTGAPGTSPGPGTGAVPASALQGVNLTASPIPLDPTQSSPAGVGAVTIPFMDPAAKDFFSVGMEMEIVVTKTAPVSSGS